MEAHGKQGLVECPILDSSKLSSSWPRLRLDGTALADVLLLLQGAYSPLETFCDAASVQTIVDKMRLPDGTLWPLPVLCPISEQLAAQVDLQPQAHLLLEQADGQPVAWLEDATSFTLDLAPLGQALFGTSDPQHPGFQAALQRGRHYVTGRLYGVQGAQERLLAALPLPSFTPQQVRAWIDGQGWHKVVAFQTRNPIHRAHEYLLRCALEICDGLLLHPLMGPTKGDDVPQGVRAACYQALLAEAFATSRVLLSAWNGPMRYAGPREAILHAIVRQNYGCTHLIVGRDHAGVGNYYHPTAAQQLVQHHYRAQDIKIEPLCFDNAFYCHSCVAYGTQKTCPHDNQHHLQLSGTQVRTMLRQGESLPALFTRPAIADVLRQWIQSSG